MKSRVDPRWNSVELSFRHASNQHGVYFFEFGFFSNKFGFISTPKTHPLFEIGSHAAWDNSSIGALIEGPGLGQPNSGFSRNPTNTLTFSANFHLSFWLYRHRKCPNHWSRDLLLCTWRAFPFLNASAIWLPFHPLILILHLERNLSQTSIGSPICLLRSDWQYGKSRSPPGSSR